MQKSSLVKYSLFATVSMLVTTLIVLPSSFRAFSQNPFTDTPSSTPLPAMIESDDSLIGRAGSWTLQSAGGASGGSYLYSSGSTEDVLTLYFEGTYISVGYVQNPSLGTMAIEVDNTVLRTVITTNDSTVYGTQAVVSYLSPGSHTLRVYPQQGVIAIDNFHTIDPNAATATPLPSSTSTSLPTLTPTATPDTSAWAMYDDRDSHIFYTHGTWETTTDSAAYQTTLTTTSDFSAEINFYFEGTGVEIVYAGTTTGSAFRFKVDEIHYELGSSQTSVVSYGNSMVISNLTDGLHHVEVMKADGLFMLDAVRVQGILAFPDQVVAPPEVLQTTSETEDSSAAAGCTYNPTNGPALAFVLEMLFSDARTTSVSICLNPAYSYVLETGIPRDVPVQDDPLHPTTPTQTALAPIMDNVTFVGNGATIRGNVNGGEPFGIFAVGYSGHLTLNDVTVTGGYLVGHWYPQSDDMHSGGYGAGIRVVEGQLTLNNAIISGNIAEYGGGGIHLDHASASITNSQIINNTGNGYGGGGIEVSGNGTLTITSSIISNNIATRGGGISSIGSFGLSISNTRITNNIANGTYAGDNPDTGGGIYLQWSSLSALTGNVLTGNQSPRAGSAIGIASDSAPTWSGTITDSCIFGNGGVSVSNPLSIALNATNNWWGSPFGPSIGGGSGGEGGAHSVEYPEQDSISGNVQYITYKIEPPEFCPQQVASTPTPTPTPTTTPTITISPMPTPTLLPSPTTIPTQGTCVVLNQNTKNIPVYHAPIDGNPVKFANGLPVQLVASDFTYIFVTGYSIDHSVDSGSELWLYVNGTHTDINIQNPTIVDGWIKASDLQYHGGSDDIDEIYTDTMFCVDIFDIPQYVDPIGRHLTDYSQKYTVPSVSWDFPVFNQFPVNYSALCLGTVTTSTDAFEIRGLRYPDEPNDYPEPYGHFGTDFFVPPATEVLSIGRDTGIVVGIGIGTPSGTVLNPDWKPQDNTHAYWGSFQNEDNDDNPAVGINVIVRYGNLYVLYGHLSGLGNNIYVGAPVTRGQLIGKSGEFRDPHLHLEVRSFGNTFPIPSDPSDPTSPHVNSITGILPLGVTHLAQGAPYIYDVMQMLNDDPLHIGGFNVANGQVTQISEQCSVVYNYDVNRAGIPTSVDGYRGWKLFLRDYQLDVSPTVRPQ